MEQYYAPVKDQKFSLGRVISLGKCDCKNCDFIHCQKNNYRVEIEKKQYPVSAFCGYYEEQLIQLNKNNFNKRTKTLQKIRMSYSLICEFLDACIKFPKGVFFDLCGIEELKEPFEDSICSTISFQELSGNSGELSTWCVLDINSTKEEHEDLAITTKEAIEEIRVWVENKLALLQAETEDKEGRGWLDKDGVFYPTNEDFIHYDFAEEFYENHKLPFETSPDDNLISKFGFVKITDFNWGKYADSVCFTNWFNPEKEITEAQFEWLVKHKNRTLQEYTKWFYGFNKN